MAERIDPKGFVGLLVDNGLDLWAGVPDSLLKDLCAAASDQLGEAFLICANEGNAVGAACGWFIGTGRAAVVYMQNSGEGNVVNPLLSLADPDVYGIPMLLVVGWRGEPGIPDEPQHKKQGKVTLGLLEAMGVEYEVIDSRRWPTQLQGLINKMRSMSAPVAAVLRRDTFSHYPFVPAYANFPLTREKALWYVLGQIGVDDLTVSTTGKEGREVFEIRNERGEGHNRDFLTVGGMGHTLSVAWGLAKGQPERTVWCLDGDGSMLMHMGSFAVFGQRWPTNLRYIINVNGCHESVGGQPNVASDVDVAAILNACGLGEASEVTTTEQIMRGMAELREGARIAMIVHTRPGSRNNLGRPTVSPADNKVAMMCGLGTAVRKG